MEPQDDLRRCPEEPAMRSKAKLKEATLREEVLLELRLLADGRHFSQQTILERYRRCAEWRHASLVLTQALAIRRGRRRTAYLTPPPGWLPPIV